MRERNRLEQVFPVCQVWTKICTIKDNICHCTGKIHCSEMLSHTCSFFLRVDIHNLRNRGAVASEYIIFNPSLTPLKSHFPRYPSVLTFSFTGAYTALAVVAVNGGKPWGGRSLLDKMFSEATELSLLDHPLPHPFHGTGDCKP